MKTQIIAEIGINHNGDLWLATKMIEQAKLCGADVVKFQSYDADKLLFKDNFSASDWEAIKVSSNLRYPDLFQLRSVCSDVGIEFMCSVFDVQRLDWLLRLNVKRFKIASRSIYDKAFCEAIMRVCKDFNKEYLVSMGWLDRANEFEEAKLNTCDRLSQGGRVKFLKCVSKYPTLLSDVELDDRSFITGHGHRYSGFSDHTIGISASQIAIAYGAKYIEKHFTFDKGASGPDHKCSIESSELKALCKFRDDFYEIKGV